MNRAHGIKPEYLQLADALRQRIREGSVKKRIPGVRTLMRDYHVTKCTVHQAIDELLGTGELTFRGARKAYGVGPPQTPVTRAGTLLAYETPLRQRRGDAFEIIATLESLLPGPVEHLNLQAQAHPAAKTAGEILKYGHSRIVLLDLPGEIADLLTDAGRTVVTCGTAGRPRRAPSVDIDLEFAIHEALHRAFSAGHRRVSLPLRQSRPWQNASIRENVAKAYANAGLKHCPDFDTPTLNDEHPERLHDELRRLLRYTPPSAFIVTDFALWLALTSVLAETRRRIPQDTSVICLFAMTDLAAVSPKPCQFAQPVENLAREVKRRLTNPADGHAPALLAPAWVQGGSLSTL